MAGGSNSLKIKDYDTGTMQDTVYNVRGGFEDWAYGASWDTKNISYNKLNGKKYSSSTNRAFVYLVEAGYEKIPSIQAMGNIKNFKKFDYDNYGHLARNIRLSLKFVELMNPFVMIK